MSITTGIEDDVNADVLREASQQRRQEGDVS